MDERLGFGELIVQHLSDSRQGKNTLPLADLLRQSVYSRIAGYEDVNDAERRCHLLGAKPREYARVAPWWARPAPATESARRFCRQLCVQPRLPSAPVYGGNNWHYAYDRNCSAAAIERDAGLKAELAPAGSNRPFMVIDDGWSLTNPPAPGSAAMPASPIWRSSPRS